MRSCWPQFDTLLRAQVDWVHLDNRPMASSVRRGGFPQDDLAAVLNRWILSTDEAPQRAAH